MKYAGRIILFLCLSFPVTTFAGPSLFIGPKVPVGFHFLYPTGGGWEETSVQTGFGLGGSIEGKIAIVGLNIDFLWQQDGTWGRNNKKVNTFRLPINLRIHVPGFFIEGGPDFIFDGGKYFALDLGFGSSISLKFISLIFETPKIVVNWWDNTSRRYEVLFTGSLMLKIF